MGAVTPRSFSLFNRSQTKARRGSASLSWPQLEVGTAGAKGAESRVLSTPTSTNTHHFRNPLTDGESSKSIPEPAVAATAWKLKHPEHCRGLVRCSEKKWRSRATEGGMPTMASQTKAKTTRRETDWGSKCNIWI